MRHAKQRLEVTQMAVNAAIRDESDEMKRVPAVGATVYGRHQCRISKELTFADVPIDSGEVLIHDPTGTEVHMADFRVSHLTGRKPDGLARRDERPVRIPLEELVKRRRSGQGDRVVVAMLPKPPSVKND